MDPNAMMGNVPQQQQEELMKAIDAMQVRDRYVVDYHEYGWA